MNLKALAQAAASRLAKGKNGEWAKEGYKFHYAVGTDADDDLEHIVTVTHPSSKENVGTFTFGPDGMGGIEAHNSFVHKDHRRKGIASEAYQIAANQSNKRVMPSFETSSDANKFWDTKSEMGIQPVRKSKDLIPGGLADGKKPTDFPAKSMKQGAKVEGEHTSSTAIAKEIAMDHLTEDPKYYDKLKTIEKSDGSKKEVASIAVISGDRLLMGKRNDNQRWTLPGGHLNPGEKSSAGAARELAEETGIRVDPKTLQLLGSEAVTTFTGKQMIIHSYACLGHFDTNTEMDPDREVQEWRWVDISNGLPYSISSNLHSPKNTTLKLLGLKNEKD